VRSEVVGQRRIFGTAKIDECDISAGLCELERDTTPDSARRSGDDRVFALEFHCARSSLALFSTPDLGRGKPSICVSRRAKTAALSYIRACYRTNFTEEYQRWISAS
jgi:hypothetical protein